jgi:hypothetical protein
MIDSGRIQSSTGSERARKGLLVLLLFWGVSAAIGGYALVGYSMSRAKQ